MTGQLPTHGAYVQRRGADVSARWDRPGAEIPAQLPPRPCRHWLSANSHGPGPAQVAVQPPLLMPQTTFRSWHWLPLATA